MDLYILDVDHKPIRVDNWFVWDTWNNAVNIRVGFTEISSQLSVSTVFLGTDHNWSGKGPPLLFETMIFGGEFDKRQWRYSTWDDAVAGHNAAVELARAAAHKTAGLRVIK